MLHTVTPGVHSQVCPVHTHSSPIRQGLFLVRRPRIWMTRSICFLRPTQGSSLPWMEGQGRRMSESQRWQVAHPL